MSDVSPNREAERFTDSIPDAMSAFWEQLVLEDETELNVEQLAAYADGRLSDTQREQIQRQLAASPSSLETLAILHENASLQGSPSIPVSMSPAVDTGSHSEATGRSSALPAAEPAQTLHRNRLRVRVGAFVSTAAAVAVVGWALVVTGSRRELHEQYAILEASLLTEQQRLALAQKELLYANGRQNRDLWSAGTMSPQMLQLAAVESARPRGGVTSEEDELLDAKAFEKAVESVDSLPDSSSSRHNRLIETAALQLAAGQLSAAEKTINEAQDATGKPSPALQNLRAVLALNQSNNPELGLAESDALINSARTMLQALLEEHGEFAPALFNLALLEERYGDPDTADDLWIRCLSAEPSSQLREAIRQSRTSDR